MARNVHYRSLTITALISASCGVDASLFEQVAGGIVIVGSQRDNRAFVGTGFVLTGDPMVVVTARHLLTESSIIPSYGGEPPLIASTATIVIYSTANTLGPICRGRVLAYGPGAGEEYDWALIGSRCPGLALVRAPLDVANAPPIIGDELRLLAPVYDFEESAPGIHYSWRDRSGAMSGVSFALNDDAPAIQAEFAPWSGASGAPITNAHGHVVGILSVQAITLGEDPSRHALIVPITAIDGVLATTSTVT